MGKCALDVAGQRVVVQRFAAWGKILIMGVMIDETGHLPLPVNDRASEPTATALPVPSDGEGLLVDGTVRVARHEQNLAARPGDAEISAATAGHRGIVAS